VVRSRDDKKVGMAHDVKSPKNQLQFSQTTMGQHRLGKTNPKKLSDQSKMLLHVKSCYGILKKLYLTEFSAD